MWSKFFSMCLHLPVSSFKGRAVKVYVLYPGALALVPTSLHVLGWVQTQIEKGQVFDLRKAEPTYLRTYSSKTQVTGIADFCQAQIA